MSEQLLEKADFDVPESLVSQETRVIAQDMVQRMAMSGARRDQIEASTDDLVRRSEQAARDRVRLTYVLEKIAENEKIEVTEADVDERITTMAQRYGMPEERFRGELDKRDSMGQVRRELVADRTLDFVLEQAKIKKA